MKLIESHIIKKSNKYFNELDNLCFLSKNLYNSALYDIRQFYFNNKSYKNYYKVNNDFVRNKQQDYYKLPTKVSQQTLKMVDQNFKSFFNHLKSNKKLKKVRLPGYLDKTNGRFILIYTIQAISKTKLKDRIIKLSGTDMEIKTKVKPESIKQVRIIHRKHHIKIEIIYEKIEKELKKNNNRYASVDLGLNNLVTLGSNVIKPLIINGKPLKSINHYFNKKLSKLKINERYKSKRIDRLYLKRDNKIKDYLHKSSRYIINHLVSNEVNTLVIGYNQEWKQEINIGKKNNQNFVQIPYKTFIDYLSYKAELEGINVIIQEESYTSKCSFIDNEKIKKHNKYKGKRIKRGLFKSNLGQIINADLNGALNILKKAVGEIEYPIKVCSTPITISL